MACLHITHTHYKILKQSYFLNHHAIKERTLSKYSLVKYQNSLNIEDRDLLKGRTILFYLKIYLYPDLLIFMNGSIVLDIHSNV